MSRLGEKAIIAALSAEVDNARHIIPDTPEANIERVARIAAVSNVAHDFADRLARVQPVYDVNGNRRFDKAWFLKMCGVSQ